MDKLDADPDAESNPAKITDVENGDINTISQPPSTPRKSKLKSKISPAVDATGEHDAHGLEDDSDGGDGDSADKSAARAPTSGNQDDVAAVAATKDIDDDGVENGVEDGNNDEDDDEDDDEEDDEEDVRLEAHAPDVALDFSVVLRNVGQHEVLRFYMFVLQDAARLDPVVLHAIASFLRRVSSQLNMEAMLYQARPLPASAV